MIHRALEFFAEGHTAGLLPRSPGLSIRTAVNTLLEKAPTTKAQRITTMEPTRGPSTTTECGVATRRNKYASTIESGLHAESVRKEIMPTTLSRGAAFTTIPGIDDTGAAGELERYVGPQAVAELPTSGRIVCNHAQVSFR